MDANRNRGRPDSLRGDGEQSGVPDAKSATRNRLKEQLATVIANNALKMLAVAMRKLSNYDDAQEAFQIACCIACQKIGQFRGVGSMEGWLTTIVSHSAAAIGTARRKYVPFDEETPEPFQHEPDRYAIADIDAVMAALGELTPGEQRVLRATVMDDVSVSDFAASEGVGVSAISMRRVRAMERLRQKILRDSASS